jgi:hypothetical protein
MKCHQRGKCSQCVKMTASFFMLVLSEIVSNLTSTPLPRQRITLKCTDIFFIACHRALSSVRAQSSFHIFWHQLSVSLYICNNLLCSPAVPWVSDSTHSTNTGGPGSTLLSWNHLKTTYSDRFSNSASQN